MPNNFIIQKPSQNAQLLTLLTNRQRAKSVPNLKNDWPGKISPNFALNLKHFHNDQQNKTPNSRNSLNRFRQKLSNDLPSVRAPQSGNL